MVKLICFADARPHPRSALFADTPQQGGSLKNLILLMLGGILFVAGCGSRPTVSPAPILSNPPVEKANLATTASPATGYSALLTNGLASYRIGSDGQCASGPSAASVLNYDNKGEEKLKIYFGPRSTISVGGKPMSPADGTDYKQSLNFTDGKIETSWQQGPVSYKVVSVLNGTELVVTTSIKGNGAIGAKNGGNSDMPSASVATDMKPGADGGTVVTRVGPAKGLPAPQAPPITLTIDGPKEDQQAINALIYYVRNSVPPPGHGITVAPFGLSNETYGGHVFWDADTWVFPALCLLDPDRAASIPLYRLEKSKVPVPWESSVTGKDVNTGPMRQELHITGDVAWAIHTAAALGIVDQAKEQAFGKRVADYWKSLAKGQPGSLELHKVIGPDEFATVDNNLYTNLLAEWCINTFSSGAKVKFKRPRDGKSLLTRDGDKVINYKQADAILACYPLQDPEAEAQTKTMLARFAGKYGNNTPLMTNSIEALLYARVGDANKGYEIWKNEINEAMRWHPYLEFREKRNKNAGCFVTGAGGCLQTVLYGFSGFRIGPHASAGSKWTLPLKNGLVLSCKPNLPDSWKSVSVHIRVLHKDYSLFLTKEKVEVK